MIAIDTSALMAMMLDEAEAGDFAAIVQSAARVLIGTPTLLEVRMAGAGKLRPFLQAKVADLLQAEPFEHVMFDGPHLQAAMDAFERFGKGRHAASLNYGDCMSYAVAAVAGCPLLFKGDDFAQTDIDRLG